MPNASMHTHAYKHVKVVKTLAWCSLMGESAYESCHSEEKCRIIVQACTDRYTCYIEEFGTHAGEAQCHVYAAF